MPHIWNVVGVTTAACGVTIPAAFGASVPNIATKQSQMTTKMYANWTLYITPIVLCGRFQKTKYYTHFMQLVKVIKLCLAFEIDEAALNQIDEGFKSWVQWYEQWVFHHSSYYRILYPEYWYRLVLKGLTGLRTELELGLVLLGPRSWFCQSYKHTSPQFLFHSNL